MTMFKVQLANLKMQRDALVLQAMIPAKKNNNNNNAQPTATSAAPVATAPNNGSSSSQAPQKTLSLEELLAHNESVNHLVDKMSSLLTTAITERCNALKSNKE